MPTSFLMLGRTAVLVAALGAMCCLLAVLVSPFAPTPISLTHGKRITDAHSVMLAPACALVTQFSAVAFKPDVTPGVSLTGVEVIRLTCARIC